VHMSKTPPLKNGLLVFWVGVFAALKVEYGRPYQFAATAVHAFLNEEFCLGFQSNTRLRLVIVRPIEAAHVEVNRLHGGVDGIYRNLLSSNCDCVGYPSRHSG